MEIYEVKLIIKYEGDKGNLVKEIGLRMPQAQVKSIRKVKDGVRATTEYN